MDEEKIGEAIEESTPVPNGLPEAPVSITVRGYYKGFSVLITKRNATGKIELEKIIQAINNMVAEGFKPSWIEEASVKPLPPRKSSVDTDAQATCPHTQFKVAQVTKDSPNKGRFFKTCITCGKFLGWVEVE